jgi:hypothetical protein
VKIKQHDMHPYTQGAESQNVGAIGGFPLLETEINLIALRKEEAGVLVMELSEHLWPEDLDLAISMVHDVARSRQNPLLLFVEVASDFDTSTWDVLWQILQPGILAQNRPSRVAVLKKTDEEREVAIPSRQNSEVQIRYFSSE